MRTQTIKFGRARLSRFNTRRVITYENPSVRPHGPEWFAPPAVQRSGVTRVGKARS